MDVEQNSDNTSRFIDCSTSDSAKDAFDFVETREEEVQGSIFPPDIPTEYFFLFDLVGVPQSKTILSMVASFLQTKFDEEFTSLPCWVALDSGKFRGAESATLDKIHGHLERHLKGEKEEYITFGKAEYERIKERNEALQSEKKICEIILIHERPFEAGALQFLTELPANVVFHSFRICTDPEKIEKCAEESIEAIKLFPKECCWPHSFTVGTNLKDFWEFEQTLMIPVTYRWKENLEMES